ncbi:heterokaryon incompatibility protein-domain-containing protein [Xylariales sp. AK1849]|nr:heterokaryon incompatibility protein-domain-containing protein [Xylariales sp. AK1849]
MEFTQGNTDKYPYEPLAGGVAQSGAIRLLVLEPAEDHDADLKGSLACTTLAAELHEIIQPFTALSYVWGDPTPVGNIRLEVHNVGITANLEAALRDIRDSTRSCRIWADALCIDQNNVGERNQQVAMMGDIFSSAGSTIIYLGDASTLTDLVFDAVPIKLYRSDTEKAILLPLGLREELLDAAMQDLLVRPWFRRVWVFQELILSRNPKVQCGRNRVGWTEMCYLLDQLAWIWTRTYEPLVLLKTMNDARKALLSYSLLDLMESRQGCHATDARDMVFAHMGMHRDCEIVAKYLTVDYDRTVEEVFSAVGKYIFMTMGLEQTLDHITRTPGLSYWPSWVPDWGFIDETWQLQSTDTLKLDKNGEDMRTDRLLITGRDTCHSIVIHTSDILPQPSMYAPDFRMKVYREMEHYNEQTQPKDTPSKLWEEFSGPSFATLRNSGVDVASYSRPPMSPQKTCPASPYGDGGVSKTDPLRNSWLMSDYLTKTYSTDQTRTKAFRIAITQEHLCWIVPAETATGDEIVGLYNLGARLAITGAESVAYVVRPLTIEKDAEERNTSVRASYLQLCIDETPWAYKKTSTKIDEIEVKHATLVGAHCIPRRYQPLGFKEQDWLLGLMALH